MKCNSLKVLCSVACIFVFHGDCCEMKDNNRRQMWQQRQNLLGQTNQLTQNTRQIIHKLQQLQDQRNEYARLEQQDLPTNKKERESVISRMRTLQDSIPALEEQLQGQVASKLSRLWQQYNQAGMGVIPASWSDDKRKEAIQKARETRATLLDQIKEATQREINDLNQRIEQAQNAHDLFNMFQ